MVKYFLLLICSITALCSASAQQRIVNQLQQDRSGQGRVTVNQDARITALLGTIYEKNTTGEP
ncbi:MAG: SPOR domain-containing protein, partial [Phocaeicola sp.]